MLVGCVDQCRLPVTHVDAPKARHRIKHAIVLAITDPDAIRAIDDAHAFLMQYR
ncbi:hypothetical protein D3C75_1389250 [compost metagenome]